MSLAEQKGFFFFSLFLIAQRRFLIIQFCQEEGQLILIYRCSQSTPLTLPLTHTLSLLLFFFLSFSFYLSF